MLLTLKYASRGPEPLRPASISQLRFCRCGATWPSESVMMRCASSSSRVRGVPKRLMYSG